jgi:hypothetical protein
MNPPLSVPCPREENCANTTNNWCRFHHSIETEEAHENRPAATYTHELSETASAGSHLARAQSEQFSQSSDESTGGENDSHRYHFLNGSLSSYSSQEDNASVCEIARHQVLACLVSSIEKTATTTTVHVLGRFAVQILERCPSLLTDEDLVRMHQDLERCLELMLKGITELPNIIDNLISIIAKQDVELLQCQYSMRELQYERRELAIKCQSVDYHRQLEIQHLKAVICQQQEVIVNRSRACQRLESDCQRLESDLDCARERNELMMRTLRSQHEKKEAIQASLKGRMSSLVDPLQFENRRHIELTREKDKLQTTNESLNAEVVRLNEIIARMVKCNETSEEKVAQVTEHNGTLTLEIKQLQEKNSGLENLTKSQEIALANLSGQLHAEKEKMTKYVELHKEELSDLETQVRHLNKLLKMEKDAFSEQSGQVEQLRRQLLKAEFEEGEKQEIDVATCIDKQVEKQAGENEMKLELERANEIELAAENARLKRQLKEQKKYYENEMLMASRNEAKLRQRNIELLDIQRLQLLKDKLNEENRSQPNIEIQYNVNPRQPNVGGISPDSGLPASRDALESSQKQASTL